MQKCKVENITRSTQTLKTTKKEGRNSPFHGKTLNHGYVFGLNVHIVLYMFNNNNYKYY